MGRRSTAFQCREWINFIGETTVVNIVIKPHDPKDYCRKVAGCAIGDEGSTCPLWLAFLSTVMGDPEMIEYLRRVCGYCLTGLITEHVLFFLYGTGANGKSVFINTLRGIMGSYHVTAPVDTFTITYGSSHPTDLAGLQGARLVTAIETEQGKRWAESKIKALTGGDEITARFMRQDFFSFTPTFKLMIAGNHKATYKETAANLFASWKAWAELMGEEPGSQKALSAALETHGMEKIRIGDAKTRGYRGIRVVKLQEEQAPYWADN